MRVVSLLYASALVCFAAHSAESIMESAPALPSAKTLYSSEHQSRDLDTQTMKISDEAQKQIETFRQAMSKMSGAEIERYMQQGDRMARANRAQRSLSGKIQIS
ncbi:MAG: hypothetical protein LBN32_02150 [Helicobacteraceae bacterium]|jgi:CHASE3 domain sensor protein|nr:hypothetical protein [Helicobacteraceae bacterium]